MVPAPPRVVIVVSIQRIRSLIVVSIQRIRSLLESLSWFKPLLESLSWCQPGVRHPPRVVIVVPTPRVIVESVDVVPTPRVIVESLDVHRLVQS